MLPNCSVAAADTSKVPLAEPPPVTLSVPLCTCTSPVLMNGTFKVVVPVPPVLRHTPALPMTLPPPFAVETSAVIVIVPVARLDRVPLLI